MPGATDNAAATDGPLRQPLFYTLPKVTGRV